MGLSVSSTGKSATGYILSLNKEDNIIALAGNPNVGKSTVFNALTGMRQHTGNWPGKTVTVAQGRCSTNKKEYVLVDIPGTYSLLAHSPEEEVARNFICFYESKAVVVVCDATCLERNLNLVLQIMEVCKNVVVCVNLLDEAKKKGISIDLKLLSQNLKVPVIGTVAKSKKTLKALLSSLDDVTENSYKPNGFKIEYPLEIESALNILEPVIKVKIGDRLPARWTALRILEWEDDLINQIEQFLNMDFSADDEISKALADAKEVLNESRITNEELSDMIVSSTVIKAEKICRDVVIQRKGYNQFDLKADKILTSKKFGYPVMLLLLAVVFWITITGANYLSEILSMLFSVIENSLYKGLTSLNTPHWLKSFIIDGVYRVPAWVVSVMLPPMAIFFPFFTLLEDSGYLPRIAYNLDKPFKCCGSCGKQALTMCMGFGCNAAGVVGCRIIDSKRERLMAIITNSLVPCNGRFPTIIAMISMFFAVGYGFTSSIISALFLTATILLGVVMTFLMTKLLSVTLLKGIPSSYTLEMPSYRRPKIGSVIVRSVFDRTLFVLGRSLSVAVPAGVVIWFLSNINIGDVALLSYCADFLDPFGRFIGLDGVILMAFILGFPANEIVIPLALMMYLKGDTLIEMSSIEEMRQILTANGWTGVTAICTVVFSLFHWPCSTTVLTIKKETGSIKWTLLSVLIPTVLGLAVCTVISLLSKMI